VLVGLGANGDALTRVSKAFRDFHVRLRNKKEARVYIRKHEATIRAAVEASAIGLTRSQRQRFFKFLMGWCKTPVPLEGTLNATSLMTAGTSDDYVDKIAEFVGVEVKTITLERPGNTPTLAGKVDLKGQVIKQLEDERYPPGTFLSLDGEQIPNPLGRAESLSRSRAVTQAAAHVLKSFNASPDAALFKTISDSLNFDFEAHPNPLQFSEDSSNVGAQQSADFVYARNCSVAEHAQNAVKPFLVGVIDTIPLAGLNDEHKADAYNNYHKQLHALTFGQMEEWFETGYLLILHMPGAEEREKGMRPLLRLILPCFCGDVADLMGRIVHMGCLFWACTECFVGPRDLSSLSPSLSRHSPEALIERAWLYDSLSSADAELVAVAKDLM
jgi:hypothetical protein